MFSHLLTLRSAFLPGGKKAFCSSSRSRLMKEAISSAQNRRIRAT